MDFCDFVLKLDILAFSTGCEISNGVNYQDSAGVELFVNIACTFSASVDDGLYLVGVV